jgi:hypothetical protein
MASHDRAVFPFAIIVDAGQQGFLSYPTDLGLTAIHRVYLVVWYSQVSYSLRSTEFCEWGGWYMGMIWREIGAVGVGIPE